MSISMTKQNISIFRNAGISSRKKTIRLARGMAAVWPSAEAMSYDLEDLPEPLLNEDPIIVTPRTCQNWRNGTTEPSYSQGQIIRALIVSLSKQQIQAARARIDALQ